MPKNNGKNQEDPTGFLTLYNKLTDIPSRVRFIADLKKNLVARQADKEEIPKEEYDVADRIEREFFDKYVLNGTADQRRCVVETIGKIKAENSVKAYYEYRKQLKKIPPQDPARHEKAKWLTDQTAVSLENAALNDMMGTVKMTCDGSNVIRDSIFNNAGITDGTTMKEFAGMCGVREKDVPAFLKKHDVKEDTNLVGFFKRKFPKSKNIAIEIATYLEETLVRSWFRNVTTDRYDAEELPSAERKVLEKIAAENSKLRTYSDLKDWIQQSGNHMILEDKERGIDECKNNFYERFRDGKEVAGADEMRRDEEYERIYDNLKTIEEKIAFIAELGVLSTGKNEKYGPSGRFRRLADELQDRFVRDNIINGTAETADRALFCIGELSTKYLLKLREDDEKLREEFKAEGKNGRKKAANLSKCTRNGTYSYELRRLANKCAGELIKDNCSSSEDICRKFNVNKEMTAEEFARKCGISEERIPGYLNALGAKSDDKMLEIARAKNGGGSDAVAFLMLKGDFVREYSNQMRAKGGQSLLDKAGLEGEKLDHYYEVGANLSGEISESGIKDWLEGEGGRRMEAMSREEGRSIINDFIKKYDKTVSYDQYIRLHTGADIKGAGAEERANCLVKAVAASVLKSIDSEYDHKQIISLSEKLKENIAFTNMIKDPAVVSRALTDADGIEDFRNALYGKHFNISPGTGKQYVEQMRGLFDSMLSSDGRSREYKAFYNAVKKISDLNGVYDETNPADVAARDAMIVKLNVGLFYAAQEYMRGKEKVRSTENGKTRFGHALDALGIISSFAPGTRERTEKIVERINSKRKAKEGSEKFVKLSDHKVEVKIPERQAAPEQKAEPKAEPEQKAEPKAEPEKEPGKQPEIKQEPKNEIKPEVKQEPKNEIKPEVKQEPKNEIKPEVKPENKPEQKRKQPSYIRLADEALARLKEGKYENDPEDRKLLSDAAVALIGQMVRATGGAVLFDRNTGKPIKFKQFYNRCIEDGIVASLKKDGKVLPLNELVFKLTNFGYLEKMAEASAKPDKGVKLPEDPVLKGDDAIKYMLGNFAKDLDKAGEDLKGIYKEPDVPAETAEDRIRNMMKLTPDKFKEKLRTITDDVDAYLKKNSMSKDPKVVERKIRLESFRRKMADYRRELETIEKGGTHFVHEPKIGMTTVGEKISYRDLKMNLVAFAYDMAEKANEGRSVLFRYDPESFLPLLFGEDRRPAEPVKELADVFTAMKEFRKLFKLDENKKMPVVSFDLIKEKVTNIYKSAMIYKASVQGKEVDEVIAQSIDAILDTCCDELRNIEYLQPYMDMETPEGRFGDKNVYDVTKVMGAPFNRTVMIAAEDTMIKPDLGSVKRDTAARQIWSDSKEALSKGKLMQKAFTKSTVLRTKIYVNLLELSNEELYLKPADPKLNKATAEQRKKDMLDIAVRDIFIRLADDTNSWMDLNKAAESHADVEEILFKVTGPDVLAKDPAFLNVHEKATYRDIADKVLAEAERLGTLDKLKAKFSPQKMIEDLKANKQKSLEMKAGAQLKK